MRTNQLVLIETSQNTFRIDDRTRATGREGIALAREMLRKSAERAAIERDESSSNRRAA
jgi:hypothetical protein